MGCEQQDHVFQALLGGETLKPLSMILIFLNRVTSSQRTKIVCVCVCVCES